MRIVIKVGTSTLAHPTGRLNIQRIELLCKVMSDLKNAGHQIILVSSGAIAMGFGKLNLPERPKDVPTKQASAAVGQCELMYTYDKLFAEYSHTVAQLLVTWEDFDHPHRLDNLQNTLERLIQLGAVPVINENDPISTEEYSLGDNDRLGALIAKYTHADLLVLLSDIDGLYTADPHTHPEATLIHRVESVTPEIEQLGGGSNSGTHSFTSPYGVLSALRPSSIYHVPFSNQPFMVLPLPQQTHTMSLIMQRCFSPLFSFQLSSCTGGGFLASCHDILRTKSTTIWLASLRAFAAASLPLKPL